MANLLMCWADVISIHAPREGGDIDVSVLDYEQHADFNPRPPRGGRHCSSAAHRRAGIFQSTPPARGATELVSTNSTPKWDFNPRPPRGGRPQPTLSKKKTTNISIHAPREGGDVRFPPDGTGADISIHAPREGGDGGGNTTLIRRDNFNPRPPRGGRRQIPA